MVERPRLRNSEVEDGSPDWRVISRQTAYQSVPTRAIVMMNELIDLDNTEPSLENYCSW